MYLVRNFDDIDDADFDFDHDNSDNIVYFVASIFFTNVMLTILTMLLTLDKTNLLC